MNIIRTISSVAFLLLAPGILMAMQVVNLTGQMHQEPVHNLNNAHKGLKDSPKHVDRIESHLFNQHVFPKKNLNKYVDPLYKSKAKKTVSANRIDLYPDKIFEEIAAISHANDNKIYPQGHYPSENSGCLPSCTIQ